MSHLLLHTEVAAEWVDYNGHMNDAEYGHVFCTASNLMMDTIGLDAPGRAALQCTLFTLESHICYLAEVHQGEPLRVMLDILDRDAKRIHAFFSMYRADDTLVATGEQLFMAMSTTTRRPTRLPEAVNQRLDEYGQLPRDAWPKHAGRPMGIRRPSRSGNP